MVARGTGNVGSSLLFAVTVTVVGPVSEVVEVVKLVELVVEET